MSTQHGDIQREALSSAIAVRLYGVPLEDANTLDGYIAILWSGFCSDGEDRRQCTRRVWHLPQDKVLSSGEVEGFACGGMQVHWFDMYKDTAPIEETFTAISIGAEIKRSFHRSCAAQDVSKIFAAHVAERPQGGKANSF